MTTPLPQIVRASSMPLAVNCPASLAVTGDPLIDSHDPAATDGQDIHRAIALAIKGKAYPAMSAENESLVELAVAWHTNWLTKEYPQFQWACEVVFNRGYFGGTIDQLGLPASLEQAAIVDYKATYRDDDHTAQLIGYAWLVLMTFPDVSSVTIIVPLLRLGRAAPPRELTRDWVMAWMTEFCRNTLDHPEIYRPGEWCSRCKRKMSCPALLEMNRQTVDVLIDSAFEKMLTRHSLPQLRTRVKLLKDSIALFEEWQRTEIIERGPLPLANGKVLKAVESKQDVIGLRAAFPILQDHFFDDAELEKFIEVKKTKMLDLIGEAAPNGMKGKNQDAFMERLKAAGAVSKKTVVKVMECNG